MKKGFFLFLLLAGSYVFVAAVAFSIMVFRWFTVAGAQVFGGDLAPTLRGWIAIGLSQMPWIIWSLFHAWYKYNKARKEATELRGQLDKWNENLRFEGLNKLLGIDYKITRNNGTFYGDPDEYEKKMTESDAERLRRFE